jgi:hypothetical protein
MLLSGAYSTYTGVLALEDRDYVLKVSAFT